MKREITAILERRLKEGDLAACRPALASIFDLAAACYGSGGKLLLCGNGGSASDCEHLSGELMKSFMKRRPLAEPLRMRLESLDARRGAVLSEKLEAGLPAIPLVNNAALFTAILNDLGGDFVFAQQVLALGRPGDLLIGFSTSGNSANVVNALLAARAGGMKTAGFTGPGRGEMKGFCDALLTAPGSSTAEVQASHLACYHALAEMLEADFF